MGLSDTNRRQARPQAPVAALRKLSDNKLLPLLARVITPDHAECMPWSKPPLNTSTLRPQLQSALMRRLSKTSASKKNALQQGFTLVELMIVIVIVGILSAVALPNFLSQTGKAKATEAKTNISATLKQAQAKFTEDGADPETAIETMTSNYGTPADGTTKFDYTAEYATPVYTVTATGNESDSGLTDKTAIGCVNFTTGIVKMTQSLDDAAPDCT
jgi:type IV pilus assembly protein PilA